MTGLNIFIYSDQHEGKYTLPPYLSCIYVTYHTNHSVLTATAPRHLQMKEVALNDPIISWPNFEVEQLQRKNQLRRSNEVTDVGNQMGACILEIYVTKGNSSGVWFE